MIYVIRNKSNRKLLGLAYASTLPALWDIIDEGSNPDEVEFCSLDTDGGAVWFNDVTDEGDSWTDGYRYPVLNHVTCSQDFEAGLFDAYQEYLNHKDDDVLEWQQYNRTSFEPAFTKDKLIAACDDIEAGKQ